MSFGDSTGGRVALFHGKTQQVSDVMGDFLRVRRIGEQALHTKVFHQLLGEVRVHVSFQAIDDGDQRALSTPPNLVQERFNTAGKSPMVQKQ